MNETTLNHWNYVKTRTASSTRRSAQQAACFSSLPEEGQDEIAPILAHFVALGRRQGTVGTLLYAYRDIVTSVGMLDALTAQTAPQLTRISNLLTPNLQRGCLTPEFARHVALLKAAKIRLAPGGEAHPYPKKRGEPDPLVATIRSELFQGADLSHQQAEREFRRLLEHEIPILVRGIPALQLGDFAEPYLTFLTWGFAENCTRAPGIWTSRLKDIVWKGELPKWILIEDPAAPNKGRVDWILDKAAPYLLRALVAHPMKRPRESPREFCRRLPNQRLSTIEYEDFSEWLTEVAAEELDWDGYVGTLAFRPYVFSKNMSSGMALEIVRLAGGHTSKSDKTLDYMRYHVAELDRERRNAKWTSRDIRACLCLAPIAAGQSHCESCGRPTEDPTPGDKAATALTNLAKGLEDGR